MAATARYKKCAIVLGAGASKGAYIVHPSGQGKYQSPPLDSEFLATAKYLFGRKGPKKDTQKDGVESWKKFCAKVKTAGLNVNSILEWRLEELSTYLEARVNLSSLQYKGGKPADYQKALDSLNILVCYVLSHTNGTSRCNLHASLFGALSPKAVISFNYDLIADQTLINRRKLAWTNALYSGSKTIKILSKNNQYQQRQFKKRKFRDTIPLYKLHGSIHWHMTKKKGRFQLSGLKAMPSNSLEYGRAPERPFIIPPVAAKMDIANTSLRKSWSQAAKILRKAPCWIIWGYSFPATDTISTVLFKTALGKNTKPKNVLVINPDPTVEHRINKSLGKVKVKQWLSVERFLIDNKIKIHQD